MKRKGFTKQLLCFLTLILVIVLVACSSDNQSEVSSSNNQQQSSSSDGLLEWTYDSDCSLCHANEHASFTTAGLTASKHAGLSCGDCHTDASSLQQVHDGVAMSNTKGANRLSKTSIDSSVCLTCHNYEDLAEATVSYTKLTDSLGTTVNPHEATTVYNELSQHDKINCVSCHTVHASSEVDEKSTNVCTSCHHENVYQCFTCHD